MFHGPLELLNETEADHGWRFDAQFIEPGGTLRKITFTLSWADYDLFCPDGGTEPSLVAETVLRWMIGRGDSDQLSNRLDASLARRLDPDADAQIRSLFIPRDPP
ncbi:MAG: hypothetical protein K8R92_11575 [Planctomycetes bacterium]|nr:hypothetical protein [Planctomycetota bacterium]